MLRFETPGNARGWYVENHTFQSSSDDDLVFVVQSPFVSGDKLELGAPRP